nr:MAG TPA: hypothetical protein [Caudoviricetes sp.]
MIPRQIGTRAACRRPPRFQRPPELIPCSGMRSASLGGTCNFPPMRRTTFSVSRLLFNLPPCDSFRASKFDA